MRKTSDHNGGSARGAILDAAEELFAGSGFDGVPIREIAKHADVNLSLVTYHFPSKDQLIEEVIARRADVLNTMRTELLEQFILSKTRNLKELMEAFTRPFLVLVSSGDKKWTNYGEILAQFTNYSKYANRITRYYDDIARNYAHQLKDLFGHSDSEKAVQAMVFSIAVMMTLFSGARRADALSDDKSQSHDPRESYPIMLDYICGGIERIMSS